MKIPVTRSDSTYPLPYFAHPGDAGADLCSNATIEIEPGARALVPTGLSIAIPDGHAGLVLPRSGLAVRNGVTVVNAPGLIDAGYRGELSVALINHGDVTFSIQPGDRIAQLVIVAVQTPQYVEVESLDETERSEGGFGSSGVASN
jgi:dUTP pyrophosphatase